MIRTHRYILGLLLLGLSPLSHALNCNDVESIEWADFTKEKAEKYLDVCMEVTRNNKTAHNYFLIGKTLNKLEQNERAYKYYSAAAEAGYPAGQNGLGVLYYYGEGVDKNHTESVKWYKKAAEQGFKQAQHNLALAYANGKGVDKNPSMAVKWYRKAAEQGFKQAQHNLALAYANGKGVDKNPSMAVKWYRKAAEQGYAPSQVRLGDAYYHSNGINKSYSEAAKWFRKAATQDNDIGQAWIGLLYENGEGGYSKNITNSISWYRKAAEQGNDFAKAALTRLANTKNNACETLKTSLEKDYYVNLDLRPNQSSCYNVQSYDGYLSVITVKNLTEGGDAFATVHELQTDKPAGEGDLIPFSDLSTKKYRIYVYNNNAKSVETQVYVHEVGFERALEGAIVGGVTGAMQAAIETMLGSKESESNDYLSLANNTSRALSLVSSYVQGANATKTSINAAGNEVSIMLQKSGFGNVTSNIITSAVSTYLGDIFRYQ